MILKKSTKSEELILVYACAVIILFLSGIFLFWDAISGSWVWDDHSLILRNPLVTDFHWDWDSIGQIFKKEYFFSPDLPSLHQDSSDYYRPMAVFSYAVIYKIFGNHSIFFHLINFFLHSITTLLLIIFTQSHFPGHRKEIFFSGLIFFLHPIHHQAVFYNTGIVDTLSALFGMVCLIFFDYFLREAKKTGALILSFILYSLSILTKEICFLIPFIAFIRPGFSKKWKFGLLFFIPFTFYFYIRKQMGLNFPLTAASDLSVSYFGTTVFLLATNLVRLIVPFFLGYFQRYFFLLSSSYSLVMIILFSGTLLFLIHFKKKIFDSVSLFGIIWFVVLYFPLSNVYPLAPALKKQAIYFPEHLLYLPSFGVFLLLVCEGKKVLDNLGFSRCVKYGICFTYIIFVMYQSTFIARVWNNEGTLHAFRIRKNPNFLESYQGLSYYYLQRQEYLQAFELLNAALGKSNIFYSQEQFLKALTNLAHAQVYLGKIEDAKHNLNYILRYWRNNYIASFLLAEVYRLQNDQTKASQYYQTSRQILQEFQKTNNKGTLSEEAA